MKNLLRRLSDTPALWPSPASSKRANDHPRRPKTWSVHEIWKLSAETSVGYALSRAALEEYFTFSSCMKWFYDKI
ncbi:hypothetical protein Taro_015502 [Colocasia esculenta]|uniref:Uncharacterized protein n=1 Tax=Colocasia esculenta TaxID=4460 RepID=A0A843UHW1_COLES|nr:hypothetical protein [Colocasia esculenta]